MNIKGNTKGNTKDIPTNNLTDNSITDVPGIRVGHATNAKAGTGCTVIICPNNTVGSAEVRGSAPGTREIPAIQPVNLVQYVNAIYLGGGSAFGLDGATGVMKYLEENKIGFDTGVATVPIVPGAVLFDLPVGMPDIRPDAEMGYQACLNATENRVPEGNVGAGTGASVGKVKGMEFAMKGGLGTASIKAGNLIVGAIVAVNCLGDVIDPKTGEILAGTLNDEKNGFANSIEVLKTTLNSAGFTGKSAREKPETEQSASGKTEETGKPTSGGQPQSTNTTIGVVATNAKLDKSGAKKIAMMAHDGLARTINPIHTMFDGDTIFALATGEIEADITTIGALAAEALAIAVTNGIKKAQSAYGLLSYNDLKTMI